jgi:hypothetical protein
VRRLPLLTNSEMRTFRRCPREHHYSYRLGYRPVKRADALRFGSLIHTGLEVWWKTTDLDAALRAMKAEESDPFELAKAEAMLMGYHARWIAEPLDVLAVESQFECALTHPTTGQASTTARLGGKVDAVARTPDGKVWLVEHKSTSEDVEAGSGYWKRLRLDSQVATYFVGARSLGFDVAGCLYDVLKKVALKPYKATPPEDRKFKKDGTLYANQRTVDETPEEYRARILADIAERPSHYYVRATIVRSEDEEKEAAADAWMHAQAIHEAEVLGRHPKNVDSCLRFSRECDYFAACTGTASITDPLRYRKAKSAHEELDATAA